MIPWYVWCVVLATTSSMIGALWDISWHRTIGRDTFWTPAHIAIYLCGVLAGVSCGYLILATTFSKSASALRAASVQLWGFRGPLGAFIAAWGGIAMLASAPLDDWWHNAYGLDVRIISPPHAVLALGMFAVMLGALLLCIACMNRAEGSSRDALERIYIYLGGLVLLNMATFIMEYTFRVNMHSAVYYRSVGLALPFFLVAISRASGLRYAATKMAAVYMLVWNAMNWILPLFPAEPKLGPVLNPVTHFVPSWFSFLLVVPAFAIDWILDRTRAWSVAKQALLAGAAFMAVMIAVHWPFGEFLQTEWARNWFFYATARDYRTGPNTFSARNLFVQWERTPAEFWINLTIAFAASIAMTWIGLYWGRWLRKVQR
jgi:hypothetical protein